YLTGVVILWVGTVGFFIGWDCFASWRWCAFGSAPARMWRKATRRVRQETSPGWLPGLHRRQRLQRPAQVVNLHRASLPPPLPLRVELLEQEGPRQTPARRLRVRPASFHIA